MSIESLKELINQKISSKTPGEEKIKASEHKQVLNAVVDTLVLLGTQSFKGVATPTTNPGTPAGPVLYIAEGIGTYQHFGNADIVEKLAFIIWDGIDWKTIQIHVDVDVEIENIQEYLTDQVINNADIPFKSKDNTFQGVNTFKGPVIVENDIIQKGETYVANWKNLYIENNLAIINEGEIGDGVTAVLPGTNIMFTGWGADRGLRETFYWGLDDTDPDHPRWKIGKKDSLQVVATREDNPIDGFAMKWDEATNQLKSAETLNAISAILQDYLHLGKGFVTQQYQSGFDGHGAKLNTEDSENTILEVDRLIVRKDMKIHELVVKKIRNVGGSLLVTNGSEADSADDLGETASLFSDGVWSNNENAIVTFTDLWQ